MNMQTKVSLCLLPLVALAGCAGPSAAPESNLGPNVAPSTSREFQPASAEAASASSQPAATESPAAPPPSEFDPDGLSIGPGSGFVVLDDPVLIPGTAATWLDPEELVLGVVIGDDARAYPISQMAYHHIANDQINGEPYLVTY